MAMTKHIIDAIGINIIRLPKYWKLTKGRSAKFSMTLIAFEIFSLPLALILDIWAIKYQINKIPVMKYEFLKMKDIPVFSKHYPVVISDVIPSEINIDLFYDTISNSLKKNNFDQFKNDVEFQLSSINNSPRYLCITRHLLESMLRAIGLMNLHIDLANKLNTKAPVKLSKTIISMHLLPLRFAYLFDLKVKKIQLENVPFIYQDLPDIPMYYKPYP